MKKIPKFKTHIHEILSFQSQKVAENREEILLKTPHFMLHIQAFQI